MSNFLWVKTPKREALLEALNEIPEISKKSKSVLLEMALEEFVKKHAKSNNPQTQLEMFDKKTVLAIPNIYRDEQDWNKFYKNIKTKKDYQELDNALNMINKIHNRKLKEF